MARIRSVKPELPDDEDFGQVSHEARLLFLLLITQADDDGRLPGNTRWLLSKLYPYDVGEVAPADVEAWLEELHEADLAWLYEANARPYVWLCGWEKNQSIDKRYYTASKLPEPPHERPPSPRRGHYGRTSGARRDHDEATTEERRGGEGIGEEPEANASSVRSSEPSSLPANEEKHVSELPTGGRLSELLADLVARNGSRRPRVGESWLTAERLLVVRDQRDPAEAERLIRWCQVDEFWRANVLSMPKFREQYDRLRLQAQRNGQVRAAELVERGRRAASA